MEALSTKEREYVLRSERDFEAYEKRLLSDKEKAEKELTEAQVKLEATPQDNEKQVERLTETISTLENSIKDIEGKISKIPAKKEFIEKYGPTKWTIKSIGRRRKFALMSSHGIGKKNADASNMGGYMCAVVEENLIKWENLRDKAGVEIPFTKESVDFIEDETFSELFNEITGTLDEDLIKN